VLFAPERAPEELYDLQKDPYETTNLSGNPIYREILESLRARLERWSRETHDQPPESAEVYELEMDNQLVRTRDPVGRAAVERNVVLMKRWARERPLQMELSPDPDDK
jgi:hypothetical protein